MGKAEKVGKPVERERKGMWGSVAIGVLVGLLVLLLGTFLAVLFSGYAEILIVQLLRVEQSETEGSQKYQALKFLGIGMGGMLLALQALIANKRAKAMENTATAQLEANQATGRGQRQERMKNAIEHLGNDRDSVRLGGAYELFHLAEDTKDSGQRQTVLDILCAHIRWTTREPKYRDKHQSKPSEEIQSLLTLLFVQRRKVFTGLDINLEGSLLNGSNLSQARLEKAALARAELHGANLEGARLSGADLFGARLSGAHLSGAQLHGANLRGARLPEADFGDAQLHGANLTGAQLHGAYLWGAELHGAYLEGAQLHGAYLTDVQLPGGTLSSQAAEKLRQQTIQAEEIRAVARDTLVAESTRGKIEIVGQKVRITHKGFVAFTQGTTGTKEILISQISSIQFRLPGKLLLGYIQFTFPGSTDTKGVGEAAGDENALMLHGTS